MRKTWRSFKVWADRYRYMLAVVALVFGSAIVTLNISAVYYERLIAKNQATSRATIDGLRLALNTERGITRAEQGEIRSDLLALVERMDKIAVKLGIASAEVGKAVEEVGSVTDKADKAASKAERAARRAQASEARTKIRIREIVPADSLKLNPNIK